MAFARALNAGRVQQLLTPPGPDFGVKRRRDPSPETHPLKSLKGSRKNEAVGRAQKIAQSVAPPHRQVPDQRLSQAEERNVKKESPKQYDSRLQAFRPSCRSPYGRALEAGGPTLVMRLFDHLGGMRGNCFHINDTKKVMAASQFTNLWLAPPCSRLVLRLTQALKGYRKAMPPRARMGITEEVMVGLANSFANEGHLDAAVEAGTWYYCYLRPGESRKLPVSRLGSPGGGRDPGWNYPTWTVPPQEEPHLAKTQAFDDAIVLANDTLARRRPPKVVPNRGRWRSLASVARYAKEGQLQLYTQNVPVTVQEYNKQAPASLRTSLEGRRLSGALPLPA